MHPRWLSTNTNKMQLCNRIYYSKVYCRLNIFRAVHRSSSGAINCICSLCRGCKYSLELLMMSGVPLETCWAFKKLWNNKFYYKAASCWYFYWDWNLYSYNRSQQDALFLNFSFDRQLYMFRTDMLSIIRSLNIVFTAIGICHTGYVDCLLADIDLQRTMHRDIFL